MSFPAYPAYRDSGVEWLGSLPAHWTPARVKDRFQIMNGATPRSDVAEYWDGDVVWVTPADLSGKAGWEITASQRTLSKAGLESCAVTLVPPGSIVLSTRAPIGSIGIAAVALCTNQGCRALVPHVGTDASFFAYALTAFSPQLNLHGRGTTFLELSADALAAFAIPAPPPGEQRAIAVFLDRECGKIDRLVAEQERLIALLKEKRQAVISQAVTKGLDPDAPMKETGIEWLGQVPANWEVRPLKAIARLFGRIGFRGYTVEDLVGEGEGAVALSPSNMIDGTVRFEKCSYVKWEKYYESPEIVLSGEDVIIVKTGSTYGKIAILPPSIPASTVNPQIAVFKHILCEKRFLYHAISSQSIAAVFKTNNTGGTIPTMTQKFIEGISIALPSEDIQRQIVTYLDEWVERCDTLTTEAERAIALLKERRAALISAAVTGKIDVRSLAAPEAAQAA